MMALAHDGAFAPLSEAELERAVGANATDQAESVVALAIPEEALLAIPRHPQLGPSSGHWVYRDRAGQAWLVICRFDPAGRDKEIRPLIWCRHGDGHVGWSWTSLPAPRPLFSLDR